MSSRIGIDTNILVYAVDTKSTSFTKSRAFILRAFTKEIQGIISPQNLTEFYATVTNKKVISRPLSTENSLKEMRIMKQGLTLVYPNIQTIVILEDILRSKKVIGQHIHDVFLAATLLSNGIKTLVTENEKDFQDITGLKILSLEDF